MAPVSLTARPSTIRVGTTPFGLSRRLLGLAVEVQPFDLELNAQLQQHPVDDQAGGRA
jgi:hypothetical protein